MHTRYAITSSLATPHVTWRDAYEVESSDTALSEICTFAVAEFEDHRPLYEWILDNLPVPSKPRQIEFSRLNLQYCVVSKRKLIQLVQEKHVQGWDDPRMPTLCGLRRRGVPPEALRLFIERTGVSKADNNIDYSVCLISLRNL
jgi:glutaminyl-tRNA synthetase